MSRWMGVFWVALGLFILISGWLGKSSFIIPHLNINLGWIVIALGLFRVWWWWTTEEQPRRRKMEARAEQRQFNLEMSQALEEQGASAEENTDAATPQEDESPPPTATKETTSH